MSQPQQFGAGPSAPRISPRDLAERLKRRDEIAVLDVRELGVHIESGHILLSVPMPLSHVEQRAATLLPRRGVPVAVYDGGPDGLAERAAGRLRELGYGDVSILDGGVAAWAAAGLETYTGVHVLSKAFGEFVEHAYGTPKLAASELKARVERGDDLVILDGRTLSEFNDFSIPGAYACPNAELPFRAHDLIRSPDTLVVVNCAGRTRSIIGAQALRNAGLPNAVVSLENGTMAWLAEGYRLNSGTVNAAPAPSPEGRAKAREAAERLRRRFGFGAVDRDGLLRFVADATRTTYRLDVRTRAEFEAGHLPGSVWAEGGQLIQATDSWIGTRNARVVLIDDADGARAAITASWLIQLGWDDVHVAAIDPASEALEIGRSNPVVVGALPAVETLTVDALSGALSGGATVLLDLSDSLAYAKGHIPGGRFAIRSRLAEGLARLPRHDTLVLTAEDPVLPVLAAGDLRSATGAAVKVLAGGNAAWRAAGLPVETGATALHDAAEDVWQSPYYQQDRLAAFQRYLDWEIALAEQIGRDETVSFKRFSEAARHTDPTGRARPT